MRGQSEQNDPKVKHETEESAVLQVLTDKGGMNEEDALKAVAAGIGYRFEVALNPKLHTIDATKVPINYLKKNLITPLSFENDILEIATSAPFNREAVDDLRRILGARRTTTVLSPAREVVRVLNQLYDQAQHSSEQFIEELDDSETSDKVLEELSDVEDLMDSTSEAPAIRLVNYALAQAIKNRASDIHIEPYRDDMRVRYRIDGMLYDFLSPPKRLHSSIVSRIKVMASLNIAENRLPQDGRIQIKIGGREIDIRVSVIPTFHGERIVLRLLDKKGGILSLDELGLGAEQQKIIVNLIQNPHGIILVTGPTGSGKTTSLYAALSSINANDKNIITIEDPIEYQLHGIGQIQVSPKIGLTFASGLRSILRHDPDIIMVGEIRDIDTVRIAVQASLTGHLVFSTLHTNNAVGAVTRLIDMGVEPFLITSSLTAVVAQRLVRKVCPHCQEEYRPPAELIERLGIKEEVVSNGRFALGVGCDHCFNTGYMGRVGIFEVFVLDDSVRRKVLAGADSVEISKTAKRNGLITLREDGIRRAGDGVTTLDEVLRIAHG